MSCLPAQERFLSSNNMKLPGIFGLVCLQPSGQVRSRAAWRGPGSSPQGPLLPPFFKLCPTPVIKWG